MSGGIRTAPLLLVLDVIECRAASFAGWRPGPSAEASVQHARGFCPSVRGRECVVDRQLFGNWNAY